MSNSPMFHEFLRGNVLLWKDTPQSVDKLIRYLTQNMRDHHPILFNAQSVFEMFPTGSDSTLRDLKLDVIPSIPPFDDVWMEWHRPKDDSSIAVHFTKRSERLWDVLVFDHCSGTGIEFNPWISALSFDEQGIYESTKSSFTCSIDRGDDLNEQYYTIAANAVIIALYLFMFAHCRNVDVVERLPKRHEQRQAKRAGQPILKYHEIVIDPNRSYATTETSVRAETKPSRALHIARGHFAHYTEDRPLFGKYSGTFWVPAHVRGSAEIGTVKSTYKVKARQEAA